MKLSISLPEAIGQEIRGLAKETQLNISWWLQRAWKIARGELIKNREEQLRARNKALKKLGSLQGKLKIIYPRGDSVSLGKQAFKKS